MRPFIGGGPILIPVSHVFFALAALALLSFGARAIRRREQPVVERAPADAPAPVAGS
jgi:membrane protein implicated in regulation of membrane protease activity